VTRELKTQIGPKARQAEEARLSRLCKSIHKHKAGLDFAVEESFGGELDRKARCLSTKMRHPSFEFSEQPPLT